MRAEPRDSMVEWLLDAAGSQSTEARRMFGGYGVYEGDVMFAIVHEGVAYLKVDAAMKDELEAMGAGPFRPSSKQTLASYYEVPADILEDRDTLRAWALRATGAARVAARRKGP